MTPPNTALTGKVILVTGAADGIGQETTRDLATRGAKVIIHARSPTARPAEKKLSMGVGTSHAYVTRQHSRTL